MAPTGSSGELAPNQALCPPPAALGGTLGAEAGAGSGALSCSLLLTKNNACNGPLMLVPGSHRHFIACQGETPEHHYLSSLKKQEYGVPDPISLQLLVEQGGIRAMTAGAGSVVFFDCNAMHGSNGNISPWPRANVFMVYNSVENRLVAPFHGMKPRPEHIAARQSAEPLSPLRVAA